MEELPKVTVTQNEIVVGRTYSLSEIFTVDVGTPPSGHELAVVQLNFFDSGGATFTGAPEYMGHHVYVYYGDVDGARGSFSAGTITFESKVLPTLRLDHGYILPSGMQYNWGNFVGYSLAFAAAIFTENADTVDFNNLSQEQRTLVGNGAPLYEALSGNDVVTLPSISQASQTVAEGKTLEWNYQQTFNAGGGNDRITGGDGDDRINGADGNDIIRGGSGDDVIWEIGRPGDKNNVDGGGGYDRLFFGDLSGTVDTAGIVVNGGAFGLSPSTATVAGIEYLAATDFADDIRLVDPGTSTDAFATRAFGRNGADTIMGTARNDLIYGGNVLGVFGDDNASDHLYGGLGADELHGGGGDDFLYSNYSSSDEQDTAGNKLYGENGRDELVAYSPTGAKADFLSGGADIDKYFVDNGDRIEKLEIGEKIFVYGGASIGSTIVYSDSKGTKINIFSSGSAPSKIASISIENRINPNDLLPLAEPSLGVLTFEYQRNSMRYLQEALDEAMISFQSWIHRVENIAVPLASEWVSDFLLKKVIPNTVTALKVRFDIDIASKLESSIAPGVREAFTARADEIGQLMANKVLEAALGKAKGLADTDLADALKLAFAPVLKTPLGPLSAGQWVSIGETIIKGFFIELDIAADREAQESLQFLPDSETYIFKSSYQPVLKDESASSDFGVENVAISAAGVSSAQGGAGFDTLRSTTNVNSLNAGIEFAALLDQPTGSSKPQPTLLVGNGLTNRLIGNSAGNRIDGHDGDDTLSGLAGNDTLSGGSGSDTLIGGAGTDTASYAGAAGGVTVSLSITGAQNTVGAGSDTLVDIENLKGNSFNDTLTGSDGNNVLDGRAGADMMVGGAGNDTYVVDNFSDAVTEQSGQGNDLVQSSVSFSLAGEDIENLTLTGGRNTNGTGNSLANVLIGNAGNNTLNGGANADQMIGGLGNDTYIVDNAGDTVTELNGQGTDLVRSSVSFSLGGKFIENLTLTGSGNTNGTGNSLDNTITGNSRDNVLSGAAGSDIFVFNTALGPANIDDITDFSVAADTIRLDDAIFSAIVGPGTLPAGQFVANSSGTAQDSGDRIIYETDTGRLFYDSNGSAAGQSIQFAQVAAGLAITNADFLIV